MRQNTDHGTVTSPDAPPQIGLPFVSGGLRRSRGLPTGCRQSSLAPSPMRQFAVSRPLSAASASPKAAPASRGTISRWRIASNSRTSASRFLAAGSSRESQSSTADRKVAASSGSGTSSPYVAKAQAYSLRRPLRTASASSPPKSQKNGNGVFEPHSSPMNSIGIIGASKVIAKRRLDRLRIGDALEPVAERAVADLVVVLQEIDEGGRRKAAARLAAQLAAAMRGGLALIDEARAERAGEVVAAAIADSRRSSPATRRSAAHARRDDNRRSTARGICRAAGLARDRAGSRGCRRFRAPDGCDDALPRQVCPRRC